MKLLYFIQMVLALSYLQQKNESIMLLLPTKNLVSVSVCKNEIKFDSTYEEKETSSNQLG